MDNFIEIVTKPDNIPIAGLLLLIAFFGWIAFSQALRNDRLIKRNRKNEIPERMRR